MALPVSRESKCITQSRNQNSPILSISPVRYHNTNVPHCDEKCTFLSRMISDSDLYLCLSSISLDIQEHIQYAPLKGQMHAFYLPSDFLFYSNPLLTHAGLHSFQHRLMRSYTGAIATGIICNNKSSEFNKNF